MFEGTGPRTNQRLLPFVALSETRASSSVPEIEAAAVFCMVDRSRGKGGGVIIKQPEEAITFIAKMGYPLLAFPWRESTLIFDGLNQSSYTFSHVSIPDAQAFMDSLKRAAKTAETYSAFLIENTDFLQELAQERSLVFPGLLREPNFIFEMESYLKEASKNTEENYRIGLLPQTIDDATIISEIRELENLFVSFKTSVEILSKCIRVLNRITLQSNAQLRAKIRDTKEEYAIKIGLEEKAVAPRIAQLKDEYDFRVSSMVKAFEKENLPVQREKARLEKSTEQARAKLERTKLEKKSYADKGHFAAEQKCREKANGTRKEISEIENQLKQIGKTLKTIEEKRLVESIKLREELETGVIEARKNIRELEATRDAKILIHKQEMETLEKQTKTKSDQLDQTVKLLEANIVALTTLGGKREIGSEAGTLNHVPFYISCFEAESKKRYMVIPPSALSKGGILTKVKGALRRTRTKNLLVPRFNAVTPILDSVPLLMKQNSAFEREANDLGIKNNILKFGELRENIRKGLVTLRNEDWLSEKEFNNLNQKIA